MSETKHCPHCGKPVTGAALGGLCPECMLKVGVGTQSDAAGPNGTQVVKPPPETPAPPSEIATHFPQLEILECLGRGGMGVVYKARQPKLNRLVALKILAPEKGAEPKFAERFLREAQALARLSHPNIVTVHDFGEAEGMFYLLMEYVDGATLRQVLREGRMKPEEALAIVPRICEALQYAHDQGIVHRDIKPENVLLDKQGRVKIADFGIAKIVGQTSKRTSLTGAQDVVGTPHYMAPEQIEHPLQVDHRADIYSLGVVFYEMLTGELPLGKFAAPSKKVQVDVRLDEVVLHALEKEPERRYQHASEVKTDVDTIAATPSASETSVPEARAAQPRNRAPLGKATGAPAGKPEPEPSLPARVAVAWRAVKAPATGLRIRALLVGMVLLGMLALGAIVVSVVAIWLPDQKGTRAPVAVVPRLAGRPHHFSVVRVSRFGVVNEVTVRENIEHLDLDSGKVVPNPPNHGRRSFAEQLQWLKETGSDLNTIHIGTRQRELVTCLFNELRLVSVSNKIWGDSEAGFVDLPLPREQSGAGLAPGLSASIHVVDQALQSEESGLEVELYPTLKAYRLAEDAEPPLTFAFHTANGGRGLMRITEFLKNQHGLSDGLKLRFRLAEPGAAPVAPAPELLGAAALEKPPLVRAAPSQYRAGLGNGVEVEIMALGRTENGRTTWWRPGGSPLGEFELARYEVNLTWGLQNHTNDFFSLLLRYPENARVHETNLEFDPRPTATGLGELMRDGRRATADTLTTFVYADPFRSAPASITLRCAQAAGEPMSTIVLDGKGSVVRIEGEVLPFGFEKPKMSGRDLVVEVGAPEHFCITPWLLPADGKDVQGLMLPGGGQQRRAAKFSNVKLAQARGFRFEFVPLHWAEFRDVSLKRGQQAAAAQPSVGNTVDAFLESCAASGVSNGEQMFAALGMGDFIAQHGNGQRAMREHYDNLRPIMQAAISKSTGEPSPAFIEYVQTTHIQNASRLMDQALLLLQVFHISQGTPRDAAVSAGVTDSNQSAIAQSPVQSSAEITRARTESLLTAARVYEVDIGKYPSSLDALLKNPGDKKWKGPYIKTKEWPPTDAWGTPLRLSLSGGTNGSLPSLNSAGPDRTFDTADDLESDVTSFESTTPGGKRGAFDPWIGRYKFAQDSKYAGKPLDITRGEQGFSILLEGRKFALQQEGDHFRFTTGDMVWNKDRTSRELEWFIIAYDPDRQQFYMGAPDNPKWRQYLEAR